MSEVVLQTMIGAGAALAGAVVTHIANLLLEARREHASYRIGLYAKRLEVHQQAFKWLMDLQIPLRDTLKSTPGSAEEGRLEALYSESRRWWDANCLYLDDVSRLLSVDCIETAGAISEGSRDFDVLDVMKGFRNARRALERGIGMKHLDVKESRFIDV